MEPKDIENRLREALLQIGGDYELEIVGEIATPGEIADAHGQARTLDVDSLGPPSMLSVPDDLQLGLALSQYAEAGAVYAVHADTGSVRRFGPTVGKTDVLDARTEWAFAICLSDRGGKAFVFRPNARPVEVTLNPTPWRLERTDLVNEEITEQWLCKEVDRWLATGRPYGKCVAAGMIARLWTPPPGTAAEVLRRVTEAVIADDSPQARAFRWFERPSKDARAIDQIVSHATTLQIWLRDERAELEREVEDAPQGTDKDRWRAANHAVRWLLERDQLESVHLMLSSAGMRDELETLLRHLDKENRMPMLRACEKIGNFRLEPAAGPPWLEHPVARGRLPGHPQLLAVFGRELDAWWGRAAFGVGDTEDG